MMVSKALIAAGLGLLLPAAAMHGQTTNGLLTGAITDSSGAVVVGATVEVTNQQTGLTRTTASADNGIFLIPQLAPGMYSLSVRAAGFATYTRQNIRLDVNQSVTVNFEVAVASAAQTVQVTGAPPQLNTTSATLSDVIDHQATVLLPLNGREFTQLTLLTPGSVPQQGSQQSSDTIALGAGGISPSVNGQRGEQNNFTMDGALNNRVFTNTWAIAPPPDALEEFNVQAHITDAQFAVTSGANINVVTRAGTNKFHGDLWEFLRNDALDAQTYPETARLPYRQNQYGVYFGGPVAIPQVVSAKDRTWFSLYWEGFRSSLSQSAFANTLTTAMMGGDFSSVLGTTSIGTDSLGRPEYANELYDPTTSRPDPGHPGSYLRDPFTSNGTTPSNIIPASQLNSAALQILKRYYPAPNLHVPDGVLPNYIFDGVTNIDSDVSGIRLDHSFSNQDTVFIRFNRSNAHQTSPDSLPTYTHSLVNYAQQAALGYTHVFGPNTILNFRYGYSYVNDLSTDQPSGAAFDNAINFTEASPEHAGISLGPDVTLTNGYTGLNQFAVPLGPLEGMDYHLDLSRIIGHHTVSAGAMYYHLRTYDDGWGEFLTFSQNATAQDGLAGPTGFGPASFMLGVPDSYGPWLGNIGADQTVNWWGLYGQDQWQVNKRLVLTAGLRWDYVAPPNYHKIVSGLDALTGKFIVTGPVPPLYPQATGNQGYFAPQYNGFEPRFGFSFEATRNTVLHGAFVILDDHNNTLVQENQGIRLSWPSGVLANEISLDLGLPSTYLNQLPPASFFLSSSTPYASFGANPNNRIPYSMEFNGGIQQQLAKSLALKVDYVGSLSRFQYIAPYANTALYPGPGPISARQPFPQYGGPFFYEWNVAPASYNALQTELTKAFSSGVSFMASYTYAKSLDWQSDPYGNPPVNFYNLPAEWGPSTYSLKHVFVFSGMYALPIGRGKMWLGHDNALTEAALGGWNLGAIVTLDSGTPFDALAGADVANTGDPAQRAERTGAPTNASQQSVHGWLNPAGFTQPAAFTFGNEHRDDLVGPAYRNFDFDTAKNFVLAEPLTLQFRAEFFNILNHANYANPDNTVTDADFGQILKTVGPGREIQFAAKLIF